jgi:hypothetical protein
VIWIAIGMSSSPRRPFDQVDDDPEALVLARGAA